jgi:hypothetical protein
MTLHPFLHASMIVSVLISMGVSSSDAADNLEQLKTACEKGNATACDSLGSLYLLGEGVEQDNMRAVAFYKKACDGGNQYSCYMVEKITVPGSIENTPPGVSGGTLPAPNMSRRLYKQSDYDPSSVTQKTYAHGEVQITLIQIKDIKDSPVPGLGGYCRAWLQVHKGEEEFIDEKYYDDIFPVGGHYGLFVPRNQPSQNYFIVIVLGGYDGRLLLIDKKGKILDLMGGPFFVTSDRRFIFSQHDSDLSGLTVFDLVLGEVIHSAELTPYIHDWYKSKLGYFFTESDWSGSTSGYPHGKQGVIHLFDFKIKTIIQKRIDVGTVKDAHKVVYDFDPDQQYPECTCNK